MNENHKSPNTAHSKEMMEESSRALSSDFQHMGPMLSLLTDDPEHEPLDPPLYEELHHDVTTMEDNYYVR
jgi:hypothetical protein